MAKAIVVGIGERRDSIYEGDIVVSRTIMRDGVETNQPVITIEKDGMESIEINMTWKEAIELWHSLTRFVGNEIIKQRVDDVLSNRKGCHYCGVPYNAGGAK